MRGVLRRYLISAAVLPLVALSVAHAVIMAWSLPAGDPAKAGWHRVVAETRPYWMVDACAVGLVLLACYLVSRRLATHVTRPLEQLAASIRDHSLDDDPAASVAAGRTWEIAELDQLRAGFAAMRGRLHSSYRELTASRESLRLTNASLEAQVARRTAELAEELSRRTELERSARLLALVAEHTSNLAIVTDSAGAIEWVNATYTRTSGYTLEEARGRRPGHLLQGPGTDADTVAKMRNDVAAGRGFRVEILNYSRFGRPYWVEIDAQPVRDSAGRLTHFIAIETDITARRNAEAELRFHRERLDLALDASHTCTWDSDLVTRRLFLDARWATMLGGAPQSLETSVRRMLTLVHPDDRRAAIAASLSVETGPEDYYNTEHRVRNVHGDWLWIKSAGRVVRRDAQGRATRMIGTNTDITTRKRAETELRQQTEFLSTLQQATLDLLARRELGEVFQTLVERASAILHTPFGELLLKDGEELVLCAWTKNHRNAADQRFGRGAARVSWQAHDSGQPVVISDYRAFPGRASRYDHLDVRAVAEFPIIVGDRCLGVLSLARDSSGEGFGERDLAQGALLAQTAALVLQNAALRSAALREAAERTAALRESEERFRGVFDRSPVPIALAELPSGRIVAVNDAILAAWGRTREEILEHTTAELGLWGDESDEARIAAEMQRDGSVSELQVQMRTGGDRRATVLVSCVTVTIGGRPFSLTTFRDITAQRRTEEQRQRMEAQMRQAQKMESLGTLAGGIAHDFNNILTGIFGFADIARHELPVGHQAHDWLDQITLCAQRAKELVRQILAFSRKNESDRLPHRLDIVVTEAVQLMRSTLPAMVRLETSIASQTPIVLADATQIHQIVMNLCTNAWHALPEVGGVVRVTLEPCAGAPELAAGLPDFPPGPCVRLAVSDEGSGMSAETLEHIFEPFFTTKETGKGTGLGLAVVHGIVKSHGGAITVHSEEGVGTTFELFFPALNKPVATLMEVEPASVTVGHGERLLLVDDDPTSGLALGRIAESLNYQVTRCTEPRDALARFAAAPADFDLVIVDLAMPLMPGDLLAKELQRHRPEVPIALISGYIDPSRQASLEQLGIRAFIRKPVSREEFATALAGALGK